MLHRAVLLNFFGPLFVGVDGVEVVVEALDDESVVGFPQPLKDDLTGIDGVIASGVVGKSCSLKVLNKYASTTTTVPL